jgi:threonine dehydrogenase-like Zn-dependent dehydrogenase
MRGAVIHAPGDARFETLDDPKILHPTDAVIRTAVTCVCGSDLWSWRGLEPIGEAHPMGHEYVGFVEEVGAEVTSVKPGQFVVGSFATSDNTCANCRNGFQSNCLNREFLTTPLPEGRGFPVGLAPDSSCFFSRGREVSPNASPTSVGSVLPRLHRL